MKVLLITNEFPNAFEPNKAVFNLSMARALIGQGHEVQVVSPIAWTDEWVARRRGAAKLCPRRCESREGIEVHYPRYYYPPGMLRSRYGWFFWHSIRRTFQRLTQTFRPDVVLSYWAHPDGEAAVRAARELGVSSVVIAAGSDVLVVTKDERRRRCVSRALGSADAVVTVSQHLKAAILRLGVDASKVHVWRRGIDACFTPGDRRAARTRLGVPLEIPLIVWVGRMVPIKGLDVLMEACTTLRDRGLEFGVYLVGDGPLRQALEADRHLRGLQDIVQFVGLCAHDALPDWYRAADLTVLTSWSEGLPNVLRESLACGTPFVATNVGGNAELAAGHEDWVVEPGDAEALATATGKRLALRDPVAAPAQTTSWEDSAADLLRIIASVTGPTTQSISAGVPAPAANNAVILDSPSPWSIRQLFRRLMSATLPRSWFAVRGPRHSNRVCLTFDDGPHPQHTPRLLEVLREHGITATFFVVGERAGKYPELLRRIVLEGHELGHHSFYHHDPARVSAAELAEEAQYTSKLINKITGKTPVLFRPPHGKLTLRKLLRLWAAGQSVVLWNVDTKDYTRKTVANNPLTERFTRLRGGDIVLMHDNLPVAAEIIPGVVASALNQGLRFTSVSEGMNWR